jgi:DNA-binding NtrC family response regulator
MRQHILIVDDEADIRDLLSQALNARGYRITSAASVAEALRSCKQDPPDMIISDLQLENSDGLQMIAEMKATLPDKPVMLLTGVLFDQEVVSKVLESKVACYLAKTSSLAQILEAVRQLLNPPSAS